MKVQVELIELNEISVVAKIPKLTKPTELPILVQPSTGKELCGGNTKPKLSKIPDRRK